MLYLNPSRLLIKFSFHATEMPSNVIKSGFLHSLLRGGRNNDCVKNIKISGCEASIPE
jgi:hypothetical protein